MSVSQKGYKYSCKRMSIKVLIKIKKKEENSYINLIT